MPQPSNMFGWSRSANAKKLLSSGMILWLSIKKPPVRAVRKGRQAEVHGLWAIQIKMCSLLSWRGLRAQTDLRSALLSREKKPPFRAAGALIRGRPRL